MTSNKEIVIPVKLDEKTFKRFSRFDMLRLRRRWVRPAVFALIFIAFAVVALLTGKPQAGMIAAVLLVVGLLLPVVYIGTFLSQVNLQAAQQRLKPPRAVYTVTLSEAGVHVVNDQKKEAALDLAWKDVRQAIRVKGCVYLYVTAARAFLLPSGQASASDEDVWALLCERMPGKAVSRL